MPTRRTRSKSPRGASPLLENIRAVADVEQSSLRDRSVAHRFGDALTRATGSTPFAITHVVFFAAWLIVNDGLTPYAPFDPYPFNFLTLVVSLEAIFLTVFVLMSQNRMARLADRRAHLDLQVDLLAERELTLSLRLVHALCQREGVELDGKLKDELGQLLKETNVREIVSDLEVRLPETRTDD